MHFPFFAYLLHLFIHMFEEKNSLTDSGSYRSIALNIKEMFCRKENTDVVLCHIVKFIQMKNPSEHQNRFSDE